MEFCLLYHYFLGEIIVSCARKERMFAWILQTCFTRMEGDLLAL
jgi:hypothetical protein